MDDKKIEEIQKRIRENISGKPEVQKLLEIKKLAEETNDILRDKKSLDKSNFEKVSLNLNELKVILSNISSKEFPNIPEFPNEIKIANFPTIKTEKVEFPSNLKELKNFDVDKLVKGLSEINSKATETLTRALSNIKINNKSIEEYIPVRIAYKDKNGNLTFDPKMAVSGGGTQPAFHTGFKDSNGVETYVTLNADGTLPITATLNAGDIEIGAVEIKNSTDDTRATVGANGLYTEVRASALPTGAATEAKQDTGNTSLATIAGAVAGTEMQVDVVSVPAPLSTTGGGAEATALRVTLANDSTGVVSVDDNGGALTVDGHHHVSTANSSTAPLAGDAVYTGTGELISPYSVSHISVVTDKASATNGLQIQYSQDNTNWDVVESHTVVAGQPEVISSPHNGLYFRIVYTNGAQAQTYFRLQVMHHSIPIGNKLERIDGDIQDNHMATTTKSVLIAKKPNGIYSAIDSTTGGNLKVSVEEFEGSVFGQDTMANSLPVTIASNQTALTVDSELPAAAALADNTANPTAPIVGSALMVYDGTTWDLARSSVGDNASAVGLQQVLPMMYDGSTHDRLRGDSTDGLLVNLGSNNDISLNAGTNAVGKLLPPDIDVTAHTNYARKYYTNAGAVTDGIIWSPASGKRWHVVTMYINTSAAATITLEDDKAGGDDPVWKGELAANSGVVLQFSEKYPMASGEDAADLLITTSAGNVYVTCVGYEI